MQIYLFYSKNMSLCRTGISNYSSFLSSYRYVYIAFLKKERERERKREREKERERRSVNLVHTMYTGKTETFMAAV